MKIKAILSAMLISSVTYVSAQWRDVNFPYDAKLNGVAFVDESNGFVCGYNPSTDSGAFGNLWFTNDGGQNWSQKYGITNISINDVVLTPQLNNVWIVGDSGFVLNSDFNVFNVYVMQQLTSASLQCGYAINDTLFYCAGENGEAYRLSGSGFDWDTLVTGTTETINDIYFSDAANGWIVADGGYLATTNDSGNTWTFVQQALWGFYDFNGFAYQGSSGVNPYIVGEFGQGQFSADNGSNWYNFTTNTITDLNKIRFGTTSGGVVCGSNGFISRTIDGGGSWFTETSPRNANLLDIAFASDTLAYICGDSGVVLISAVDVSGIHTTSTSYFGASAFPNPFVQSLYVSILAEENASANVAIIDITGKTVLAQNCSNLSQGTNRVEIAGAEYLAPGMYFITVISDAGNIALPLIKQ